MQYARRRVHFSSAHVPPICSEFTYNPRLWPRDVLRTDFLRLSDCFNAQKSTVRVPDIDPKYKIAVLASKQVVRRFHTSSLHFIWLRFLYEITYLSLCSDFDKYAFLFF